MQYKDLLNKEDYSVVRIFEVTEDHFVCTKCAEILPLTECYVKPKKGIKSHCKNCHRFERKCHHYKDPNYARSKTKLWDSTNRKKKSDYYNVYSQSRSKTDILFKLIGMIRSRTKFALNQKKWIKPNSITKAIGCSILDLKIHLESKFSQGMTWENQGKWHIDHIYPLSKAQTPEEMLKLAHYTNLQPLWAIDNIRKGNKVA